MKKKILKILMWTGTHLLTAALAAFLALALFLPKRSDKLAYLESLILNKFVGECDQTTLEDGAAAGMIAATGDRWSYYIPASQYEDLMKNHQNSGYVGVGITVSKIDKGIQIVALAENGPAAEAGIEPDDILIAVDGKDVTGMTTDEAADLIGGEENTEVTLTVLRGEAKLSFRLTRRSIQVIVAKGEMLEGNIGLVTIKNFNDRCAEETIAAVDALVARGAKGLVFDVRGNPGGSVTELVKVLDHLLPEGEIFRTQDKSGKVEIEKSDASCIRLPMAVIVNGDSYSAAEFFAAALSEYDWAKVVGEQTVGKSYYQYTYLLPDGSAVALSSGKYFTPKGVSLAEVGGLTPEIALELTPEQKKMLSYGRLEPLEDPQILAAMESLELS